MGDAMNESGDSRLQRLEALEGIRRLKALFATRLDDAVNKGAPLDPVLEQFAPDAVWESELFGRHAGVDEIRAFLETYRARVSFCLHYIVGDIIDIADDRATARGQWISWEPMTLDGVAVILAARYFDDYRRAPEGWRFAAVRLEVGFIVPHDRGWAQERVPADWTW
jgi:SnoaL-like domain